LIQAEELLKLGQQSLKDKGITSYIIDTRILLATTLNLSQKYFLPNIKISDSDQAKFLDLIKARGNGKPISRILSYRSFWDSEFYINSSTLDPRPDSEVLVSSAIELAKSINEEELSVLELGVGSGCILLSILKERKNFYGTGIDISKSCLNISKLNAIKLKVSSNLKLFKSNVDKFTIGKYDLIISNPPYIKKNKIKYLEKDVAKFEPKLALDGGLDGLSEIRKVIKKSSELIKKNGKFILEIGFDQKNRVIGLLKKEGFYINSINKDFANNDRCIVSTKI